MKNQYSRFPTLECIKLSTPWNKYFSFHNTNRSPAYGDEVQYLSDLLDVIGKSSPENATALRKLQPVPDRTSASPSSPDGDNDDSVARTMRR